MYYKIRYFFLLFIAFTFVFMAIPPANAGSKGELTVKISGFPSSNGFAMIALNNSKEGFEDESDEQVVDKKRVKVINQEARVVFKDIDYGWYAVSVYHDENANGELDKNSMGIPKEAYAFSNNALGLFGKPDYVDAKFQLNSAQKQITITIVKAE